MSLIDDIRDFARRSRRSTKKIVEELEELGQSTLTLDEVGVSVGGPTASFKVNVERRVAWNIYVELKTRIATRPLPDGQGLLREALTSLHWVFDIVRENLKEAGPSVAKGRVSLGGYSLRLLEEELAPFLTPWHPELEDWEAQRPKGMGRAAHERAWEHHARVRAELEECRKAVAAYAEALGILAGLDDDSLDDDPNEASVEDAPA